MHIHGAGAAYYQFLRLKCFHLYARTYSSDQFNMIEYVRDHRHYERYQTECERVSHRHLLHLGCNIIITKHVILTISVKSNDTTKL